MSDKMVSDEKFEGLCGGPQDIVARLRNPANQFLLDPNVSNKAWELLKDAADTIETLQARVAELEGALRIYKDAAQPKQERARVFAKEKP